MGLAAPKNRSKISNDPQNTTWANNTERFGHKILTSQGWTPGASLGATDAAHKAHYTAASQSHIRVFLKDDNLGLGAKRGSERAENFGLAGFASILGRLNGKEEEVKKEEERQEKIQQRAYVYKKFGMMNFVSGGYLVGDKIEKGVKKEVEVNVEVKSEPESSDNEVVEKKSKKRKRSGEEEIKKEDEEEPNLKRKKKSVSLREEAAKEDAALEATSKSKKDKKDKKDKNSKSASETPATDSEPLSDKARRKAEKRARKEKKKLKKALKKAAKEAAKSNPTTEDPSSESESESEEESTSASSVPTTGTSTPSGLTYNPRGMHAVRQRYIRQKKMASMDPQALKEIFMIKTPS
ncbi:telomerase inhibitor [Paraphaeosphaeria minitans]|uniref:PinX1-related protein 1 n=1 Tax=Paraphaeosphaeria minitans TaxID=565426 RepID=A0A9P6G858_9PLEO|nr:g-patch domain-containing protein [Paraphaeosphaeria minitans]